MGKKLIILGGTGLLGYHTALLALKKGYEVASLSINDINLEGWYPKEIKVTFMDVFEASEEELTKAMEGYDYMVYAIGPDDRITPPAPSYKFFHERLVNHCAKAFRAAEKAGVKKESSLILILLILIEEIQKFIMLKSILILDVELNKLSFY